MLLLIDYDGRLFWIGGYVFVLVGFNCSGFIIQNFWGIYWGVGGFVVIGYVDWLVYVMDVWVVVMGFFGIVLGCFVMVGKLGVGVVLVVV